ncbi:uncharacterized protein RCC_10364 [Ramularia collo-cygni]|uniref:Serine hydrolase domain-containing protein n=1 Tax=Ramularia collo-cygni TaxID=112498 RepID=A0A2D3VLT1_9PEZI|nr:uncharacterized protein RCC_10364 [Ramularia collo-cygni]CZT24639.1 uncharacterized protein RCC_10364 [Ramularia collo-cygni]
MRVLCLHGVGGSGALLKQQLTPFIRALDPSYEFVFVDGPVQSPRGPGIAPSATGPFFSHTVGYEPQQILEACQHLEEVIEESGPFDGALGFSQGAALIVSLMHLWQCNGKESPFAFALFFSSSTPCAARDDACTALISRLRSKSLDHSHEGSLKLRESDSLTAEEQIYWSLLCDTVFPARRNNFLHPPFDLDAYTDPQHPRDAPLTMHPALHDWRIRIPTVHCIGSRDAPSMQGMSRSAYEMCAGDVSKLLYHGGGHQPPQKQAEAAAAAAATEWAINQSRKALRLRL